jgi:AraC-like DNA-binding protein
MTRERIRVELSRSDYGRWSVHRKLMPSHSYAPGPPLSEFVELMWIAEGYTQPHGQERVLPTGSMDLVIGLGDGDPEGSAVSGSRSEFFVLDTSKPLSVVGVHFRIGGGCAFFDPPAGELHNTIVPLDALWGRSFVATLRAQLMEAATPAVRFQILERALLARLRRRWPHPAVSYALRAFAGTRPRAVGDVTGQIGISPRRFVEVFRNQVGLTPKVFCRIKRFQRVLDALDTSREIDWPDIALSGGYFDQAHFIHDFRAFSGINPTAYLRHRIHRHHVPIPD